MSMPGWQASHARRSQNGVVTGPRTDQTIAAPVAPGVPPTAGGACAHARARFMTALAYATATGPLPLYARTAFDVRAARAVSAPLVCSSEPAAMAASKSSYTDGCGVCRWG